MGLADLIKNYVGSMPVDEAGRVIVSTPRTTTTDKVDPVELHSASIQQTLDYPQQVEVSSVQEPLNLHSAELSARLNQYLSAFKPPTTTQPPLEAAFLIPPTIKPNLNIISPFASVEARPTREFTPPTLSPTTEAEPFFNLPEPVNISDFTLGVPKALSSLFPKAAVFYKQSSQQYPQSSPKVISKPAVAVLNKLISPLLQPEARTNNKVVVSIPDKKVVVLSSRGGVLAEFSAYLGTKTSPTPKGQFRIMENIQPSADEWFYGPRWLGYAKDANAKAYYGFHGWVYDKEDDLQEQQQPGWKTSTHGCIQLKNEDVKRFSQLIGVGDMVHIIDLPFTPPPPSMPIPAGLAGRY